MGYGLSEDEAERLRSEMTLGQVAMLLQRRGQTNSAALMLDVQALEWASEWQDGDSWSEASQHIAVLDVDTYMMARFTDRGFRQSRASR